LILSFQIDQSEISKLDENSRNVVNFVIELRKLFALMLKSKRKAINPNATLRCLRNCSKYDVYTFNQEDVSEFATILVNLIEESFDIVFKLQQSQPSNDDTQNPSLNVSSGDDGSSGISLPINNLSTDTQKSTLDEATTTTTSEFLNDSSISNLRPISEKATLAIATANTLANNLRKNRKNPIVNLLNGDILISRKNSDEDKTHSLIEIFREVNIQMLNSRNLHAGLELEWGETSIDKLTTNNQQQSTDASFGVNLAPKTEITMNKSIYEQETWIVQLPSVLFICLNRYKFVKATQSSSKILEPFEFYPFIFLDRYMYTNRELIRSKRNELKLLNTELKSLESKLNQIKDYSYSSESYALDDILKCASHFTTTDYTNHEVFGDVKLDNTGDAVESTNASKNSDELIIVQNYLKKLIKNIDSKMSDLKKSISDVQTKINTIYEQENLKKVKYHLHSVCIHEGNATSGHFWTYIWNTLNLKWYKFNDLEVCESTWEDLYANAVGGKSKQQQQQSKQVDRILVSPGSQTNEADLMNKTSSKTNERTPSAYFLIYTKADDTNLYKENNHLDRDLLKYINEDQEALENQLNTLKLKQLLRETNENLKRSNLAISAAGQTTSSAASAEQNNQTCTEHAKAFCDSTLESLTNCIDTILSKKINSTTANTSINSSSIIDEALMHAIDLELNKHANTTAKDLLSKLPYIDLRINHILTFFSANNLSRDLKILALYDIFRIQIFPENNIKLKILQTQAQIKYNEYVLASLQPTPSATSPTPPSLNIPITATNPNLNTDNATSFASTTSTGTINPNTFKNYEKWQNDYRDFRSVIAAFINGFTFMESQRFEEAAQFFCVTCEYNERLTANLQHKMKGMDHEFLLLNRRKCLKLWNQATLKKFTLKTNTFNAGSSDPNVESQQQEQPLSQQELTNLIETMINKFLNCFFRLAGSTIEDKTMIEEIRQEWLNVLDSNLPELQIFQDFLTKLFEDPIVNHYHSLSVNKTNLANRFREVTSAILLNKQQQQPAQQQ
jgi:hypothetical protein